MMTFPYPPTHTSKTLTRPSMWSSTASISTIFSLCLSHHELTLLT